MPCGEKIHKVNEKWKRRKQREQEEQERRERELIPIPAGWPMPKPATVPNA